MKYETFTRVAVTALLLAAPLGVHRIASAADMAVKAPKAAPPPAFDLERLLYRRLCPVQPGSIRRPQRIRALNSCSVLVRQPGIGTYNLLPAQTYDMK